MARVATVLALSLVLTLAASADSSLIALPPGHMCGGHGRYAPGSAYEESLHGLAAIVPLQANASSCNSTVGNVAGERPEMVSASAFCYWRADASSSDCAACIALAFREARRRCPYHRQAMVVVDRGACSVSFHDVQRAEQEMAQIRVDGDALHPEFAAYQYYIQEISRYMFDKSSNISSPLYVRQPIKVFKSPPRVIDM